MPSGSPTITLEYLQRTTIGLMQNSLAFNTFQTYNTAVSSFSKFRSMYKFEEHWPATQQQLVLFIAYCFNKGLSPKSIKTYIAGLDYFHRVNEWPPVTSNFLIAKLLDGCFRVRKTVDNRAPITKHILLGILNELHRVCYNQYEIKLFKSLWLLAYFGLFRISELVACYAYGPNYNINRGDIYISPDGHFVSVSLNRHKTNQCSKATVLKLALEQDKNACPVTALISYINVRPDIEGSLFCHADGKPVLRHQFSFLLDKCIVRAGFNRGKYTSHSFRIGRATDLASMGMPSCLIQKMGRWSSDAYKTYIRV